MQPEELMASESSVNRKSMLSLSTMRLASRSVIALVSAHKMTRDQTNEPSLSEVSVANGLDEHVKGFSAFASWSRPLCPSELNNSPLAVFTVDKCCFDIHTHADIELPIEALTPLVFKK
ncbi:hypothetical protein QQF64_009343 [Cirrhinus molitorella]|uniref:Uncharacterized protein n=1 Tax=Cirrhinus molitorella TaxID=172907 RepID=A0ABR3M3B6_9TELE